MLRFDDRLELRIRLLEEGVSEIVDGLDDLWDGLGGNGKLTLLEIIKSLDDLITWAEALTLEHLYVLATFLVVELAPLAEEAVELILRIVHIFILS